MQIGAELLCKSAKVGDRDTFPGLRSRQSGIRYGLSGSGTGAGPEPDPGAEHLNQIPEGRDLGPENDFVPADAMSSHPYQAADLDAHTADIGHIRGLRMGWWVS